MNDNEHDHVIDLDAPDREQLRQVVNWINGHEEWTQDRDLEQRVSELEDFRRDHLTVCHPSILKWQGNMAGKWAIIAGFCTGVGLVIGYFLGRWLGQ